MFQSSHDLLFTVYSEINDELESFIEQHDFTAYRPNVGVFGENSTGKSTFLNAMLGNKEEFKMGFGETTNKITVLYKNEKPTPVNSSGFSQLHSKWKYKKANYKHLDYMNLFDIPGFGQQFSHEDLSVVVQELDIIFWFIDASKGVKKDDKAFLKNIKGLDTKVIIVLNKIDTISENDEIESLLKEINSEIKKIKTFFKEEKVIDNLVTIFPFSATKSLIGTIKEEKGAYKVIDTVVQNVLLYTVFIESYRGCIENICSDSYIRVILDIEDEMLDIISNVSLDLEYALKENISVFDSLNPFSSKDEEAEPIVTEYMFIMEETLDNYVFSLNESIEEDIKKEMEALRSFDTFGELQHFDISMENVVALNISIDLNSMSWDSLFGDSFAEEVASKFEKKVKKRVKREIPKIIRSYEELIESLEGQIKEEGYSFASELDKKLSYTIEKTQEPLLNLLLKTMQGKLDDKDIQYIEKMLNLNNMISSKQKQ